MKPTNIIKIVLAVILLLCLFNLPYGFYQLFRFIFLIGFTYLAYDANENKQEKEAIIYIVLAILFQPLIKIALGRTLWNVIDVIVAVGILYSVFNTDKTDLNETANETEHSK